MDIKIKQMSILIGTAFNIQRVVKMVIAGAIWVGFSWWTVMVRVIKRAVVQAVIQAAKLASLRVIENHDPLRTKAQPKNQKRNEKEQGGGTKGSGGTKNDQNDKRREGKV